MNAALTSGLALGCAKAEQCLNQALQYNPDGAAILACHTGKSVNITCTLPPCEVILGFRDTEFYLLPVNQNDPNSPDSRVSDARLSGHASALVALLLDPDGASPDFWDNYQGSVTLEGDTALITTLLDLFKSSRIDHEAWLANFIGDVPAHLVGQALRQLRRRKEHMEGHGAEIVENLLRDEWRANPLFRNAQRMGDSLATGDGGEFLKQDIKREINKLRSRLVEIFA